MALFLLGAAGKLLGGAATKGAAKKAIVGKGKDIVKDKAAVALLGRVDIEKLEVADSIVDMEGKDKIRLIPVDGLEVYLPLADYLRLFLGVLDCKFFTFKSTFFN